MASADFIEAEHASRLAANTNSIDGYYDHVVAVSQSMVNLAFEDMFNRHKALQEIHKEVLGNEVHGWLHPTRIMVQGGSAGSVGNKVFWMIHFKKGWLKLKQGNRDETMIIDDWKLAVEVEFEQRSLKFLDEDTTSEINIKEKHLKSLEARFRWETDRYDPSLLYAKLATGLARGYNHEHSTFGVDPDTGKIRTWDNYVVPMNNTSKELYFMLTGFLNMWAGPLENEGMTVMATQFQAPAAPKEIKTGSKPVKQLVLQTSPYMLKVNGENTGYPDGATQLDDPGSRNCICYCEVIQGHELTAAEMPYIRSGNFATIGNGKDDPNRIDGTFALSRNVLFESMLLRELIKFASASIMAPEPAKFSSDKRYVTSSWFREYGIHYQKVDTMRFHTAPKGNKVPEKYNFQHVGDPVTSGTKPYQNSSTKRYYYHSAKSNTNVDIRWIPGTGNIQVEGKVEYSYVQTASKVDEIEVDRLKQHDSILKDKFIATWNFTIEVAGISNGELQMTINNDPVVEVKRDENEHEVKFFVVPEKQDEEIKTELHGSLGRQIKELHKVLRSLLKSDLKYVYPGSGTFNFGKVIFNNNGDLLVDVKYQPVAGNELIVVPDPYEIVDWKTPTPTSGRSTGTTPSGRPSGTTQEHPDTTLAWMVTQTARAKETKQLITVSATNESKEIKYMKGMEIAFDVYTATDRLGPGETTISQSKIFLQAGGTSAPVDPGSNLYSIRDEPKGILDLSEMEKQVLKRSNIRYRCRFNIKSKKDIIIIPSNATVFVDFLFETAGPGFCDFEVDETECTEGGIDIPFLTPHRSQRFAIHVE